jgi:hypothetical protein
MDRSASEIIADEYNHEVITDVSHLVLNNHVKFFGLKFLSYEPNLYAYSCGVKTYPVKVYV